MLINNEVATVYLIDRHNIILTTAYIFIKMQAALQ